MIIVGCSSLCLEYEVKISSSLIEDRRQDESKQGCQFFEVVL